IVAFVMNDVSGAVSVTYSAGNTYHQDAAVTNATKVRTYIFSALNVGALASGNPITITHPSVTVRAAQVSEFTGLLASGALAKPTRKPATVQACPAVRQARLHRSKNWFSAPSANRPRTTLPLRQVVGSRPSDRKEVRARAVMMRISTQSTRRCLPLGPT